MLIIDLEFILSLLSPAAGETGVLAYLSIAVGAGARSEGEVRFSVRCVGIGM